ncbi:MAG: hypothetical protein L0G99_06055 [Propionibacteriales bacterium]|nr:hypothetical protein [Propionibacteriales bacterium]
MSGSDLTGSTSAGALAATGSVIFGWEFALAVVLLLAGFFVTRIAYQRRKARAGRS